MIDWADVLFVMEQNHRDILRQRFHSSGKNVIVLDIEDNYQFNDPELIDLLKLSLVDYL